MIREVHPVQRVNAAINVPGSKSLTNRALICAALATGESIICNASDSDDTALMINGLNQLGVLVRKRDDALLVSGTGGRLFAPKFPIPVGNAGTTLRFLLSLAALAQGKTTFEADMRMAGRPMDDLLEALRQLGSEAKSFGTRFTIEGGHITGGRVTLNASKSSQFLSSLLLTAPYAKEDMEIVVNDTLSSAPYVEMTVDVLMKFGVEVDCVKPGHYSVRHLQRYKAGEYTVEADASGASYFFAAAAITGGEVLVQKIRRDSLQGDIKFLDVLEEMGCIVIEEEGGIRVRGSEKLTGVDVDLNSMPDVVPTLAVVSLFAEGPTRIRNVAQLRFKESDRLAALSEELQKLGAQVSLTEDSLVITPRHLGGAQLDVRDDHRLAMSFALVGLKVPGIRIENPECVRKSFPAFWRELEKVY